jgi:muramoyltetrapeptide carboxypeptidase
VIGFSDITVLHALWLACGVPSVHGPNVSTLARCGKADREAAKRLLVEGTGAVLAEKMAVLAPGRATGLLFGGNLSVLASLCGTDLEPWIYRREAQILNGGEILFLEDLGERAYRVDRLLGQLLSSRGFPRVKGLAFGTFSGVSAQERAWIRDLLREVARGLSIPAVTGLPVGHHGRNAALPLGVRVALDATGPRASLVVDGA